MTKKILCFSIILFINIFLLNISFATDVLMDLENTTAYSAQTIDNTTYTLDNTDANTESTTYNDYEPIVTTTTTTDYEDSTELSISNMINIILIVVGVVLILLGIAIIIKLK